MILLIILILLLCGGLPAFVNRADWGNGPLGGLGGILLIVLVLYLLGVIH